MRLLPLTVPLVLFPLAYAATGGPDDGSMVYTDSDEADGPSHAWLDASGGEAHALGDDDTVTVDLPFTFDFYGTGWEEVTISSNGALFFQGASPLSTGICPDTATTWTGIAAYWDDLAAGTVHTETFGTYPWRTFVVSWDGASHADVAGSSGRFQVWLLEGRSEAVVVLDDTTWGDPAHDDGATATIGTNGPEGGLAWSCNTAFSAGSTVWFADQHARPDRAEVLTDDIDDPWTGQDTFDYAGRALATGDINGDGTDDLLVGTQDRDAGEVALIYRPDVGDNLANADATFTGETADDAYGAALLATDFDADGQDDFVIGAPGNDDAGNRAGAIYVWAGGSWSGTNTTTDADATWTGPSTTAAAGTALGAGDVDGDGYVDLVVGAPTADTAATDAGAFYVVYGVGAVPTGTSGASAADATFLGDDAADQLGSAFAVGDLDGDGADEIVTAALFADDGATDAGSVYWVAGGTYSGTYDIAGDADCQFSTPGPSARLGASLLAADIDGSGLLDLVVGGPTEDGAYSDGGNAYVFADPGATCPLAANLASATIQGARASAQLGGTLSAGDLDGDGVDDLVIGAPNMTYAGSSGGAVYVFTTAPTGTVSASTADHVVGGSGSAAALGTALAVAANPSGPATVVATAPYDSVGYSSDGAVYQWTWRPDFLDDDGDGFVSAVAGGNDCDDAQAAAYPDGTDTFGDSVDGDCDGWVDGEVRVRADADEFAWDLDDVGGGATETYGFETYGDGDDVASYGSLTFAGDIVADDLVYGAAAVDGIAARVVTGGSVGIAFADPVDALSLRVLDPDDDFTLAATGPGGAVVTGYEFALSGDDRTGGLYRGFTFAGEVTAVTLTAAGTDGFGLDAIEVAWAADSDRDGDGFSDADGDCDDTDGAVHPGATEDLSNGVDDDCDGIVDAGDATAYTSASAWEAAAAVDPSTVIDFEDRSAAEVVDDQYLDLGVLFDGALVAASDVDGTSPHGGLAAVGSASTTILFDEDQTALALYLLDGDVSFTVQAYDDGVLYYTSTVTPSSGDAFYGLVYDLSIDELVITGADTWALDDLVFAELGLDDADGDGQTEREGDCDDADATAYDGAEETWYDGVDQDCAGGDDFDADGDGSAYPDDCDDTDPDTNPSASETYYDGVDSNCDGLSDYDADEDGHDDLSFGGDDCDDGDATVSPDATEVWYDGVDQDCAGDDDDDADGDGFPIDGSIGGSDCDDTDGTISPDAEEIWYDGVDQDCSGSGTSDYDADGDGYDADAWGGDDCDDTEVSAYPGATGEVCYDGVDTDCGGEDDFDCDADGYASEDWGGDDCDDADDTVSPAATDPMGDGVDTNCDGGPEYDFDGDGYDGEANGGTDCDDADDTVSPGVAELCYDGVDQNCDDWDDDDCDLDGYASDSHGGTDCDDTVGGINPGMTDFPYDGIDSDCDGDSEYDVDGDGHTTAFYGGDDCDDSDASVYPGATDACYDGVDADCGGEDDDDCDGDGYAAEGTGGLDCDDTDAAISPAAIEVEGDGIDQDCDGEDVLVCTDCDADGFASDVDCDDTDADVYPGATDRYYDGVDANCDGASDYDADTDGADAIAWGGGDCDDADAAVTPTNTNDPCGGGDEDCDGTLDEDCDTGGETGDDTGDTDTDLPDDTGPDTRDTAVDWRPDPDELTEPKYDESATGCGCDTPGSSGAGALAIAVAGLALVRRRRG